VQTFVTIAKERDMNSRLQHILTLLGVIAIPVLTIWQSSSDLAAKISMSVATVLALCFSIAQRKQIEQIVLGALAILGPIATIILTHVTTGSAVWSFVGVALAVITDLTKALTGQDLASKPTTGSNGSKVAGFVAGVLLMLLGSTAFGQSVSPQGGGCVGKDKSGQDLVCFGIAIQSTFMKMGLSTANKGISGGWATGAGYGALLFPDDFYSIGLNLFLNVNGGNSQLSTIPALSNSRVSPMLMASFFKYIYVGIGADVVAPSDPSGKYDTQWFLTGGLGVNVNALTRGYVRAQAKKLADQMQPRS